MKVGRPTLRTSNTPSALGMNTDHFSSNRCRAATGTAISGLPSPTGSHTVIERSTTGGEPHIGR